MNQLILVTLAAILVQTAALAQVAPTYVFASPDEQEESLFGLDIAPVGDLDGDGVPDLLVAAPDEDAGPAPVVANAGQVHLFSGATGTFLQTFRSPNRQAGAFFGESALAAGDRDGDGVPDAYVSASREVVDGAGNAGRVYLLSGADGAELASFVSPDPQPEGEFGFDLARLADYTGDGVGEIGVSAKGERVGGIVRAGRLHVIDGAADTLVTTLTAPDPIAEAGFGHTSDDAGDVDGDGVSDIVTGAPFRDGDGGLQLLGRLYILSGADGSAIFDIRSPNETQNGGFGRYVVGLGDVTGDGVPDLATGANGEPVQGQFLGRVYVISGATGEAVVTLQSPNEQFIGFFGELVESAGDVDGDGRDDLLISARAEDDDGNPQTFIGRAYVFSSDGTLLQTLAPPTPDPDGIQYFGFDIAGLGDLDGDGVPEVGVGAWGENPPGSPPFAGRAYVFPSAQSTSVASAPETAALGVALYPNPARDAVTVTFEAIADGGVRLEVFDVLGRSVAVLDEARRAAAPQEIEASLVGVPPGLYFVRLSAAGRTETRRLTVVR